MTRSRRPPRELHAGIRETWEDQTLALFINLGPQGQSVPEYDLVRRGERPDRVIRRLGSKREVGVEITRAVEEDDARQGAAVYRLGYALHEVLTPYCRGGEAYLYARDFPSLDPSAIDALALHLGGDLRRAGSLALLGAGLQGRSWEHREGSPLVSPGARRSTRASYWRFDPNPAADQWRFSSNGISQPQQAEVAPERFLELLLERLVDKCAKAKGYGWRGPLLLLVRNPYQSYVPAPGAAAAIAGALADSPFDEVWLVTYRQGTLEVAPPPDTILRLA